MAVAALPVAAAPGGRPGSPARRRSRSRSSAALAHSIPCISLRPCAPRRLAPALPLPASLAPLPAGHPVAIKPRPLRLLRRVAPAARIARRAAYDARACSRSLPLTLLICPYEERQQGREPFTDPHSTRHSPAAWHLWHLPPMLMHVARPPIPMRSPNPALSRARRPLFSASRAPSRSPACSSLP